MYKQRKKKLNSVFICHAYVESMTIELKKKYRKHDVLMNRCLNTLRNNYLHEVHHLWWNFIWTCQYILKQTKVTRRGRKSLSHHWPLSIKVFITVSKHICKFIYNIHTHTYIRDVHVAYICELDQLVKVVYLVFTLEFEFPPRKLK